MRKSEASEYQRYYSHETMFHEYVAKLGLARVSGQSFAVGNECPHCTIVLFRILRSVKQRSAPMERWALREQRWRWAYLYGPRAMVMLLPMIRSGRPCIPPPAKLELPLPGGAPPMPRPNPPPNPLPPCRMGEAKTGPPLPANSLTSNIIISYRTSTIFQCQCQKHLEAHYNYISMDL